MCCTVAPLPGAQLWHLSRSDSDSGTSRLGPMAPLASLFLCSGAAATPPSFLLSLLPLACFPHASAGSACGLGAFVFQFFPCSGQAGRVDAGQSCSVLNSTQARKVPPSWLGRAFGYWNPGLVSQGDKLNVGGAQPPPRRRHTCGQLPVSLGAPAPGISSCLHRPHPGWAPHSHLRTPRSPDTTHSVCARACTRTHTHPPRIHVATVC